MAIFVLAWPGKGRLPTIARCSWKQFDYVGSFLVIAASVLVVFAFQNIGEASNQNWGGAGFIAPLVAGLVSLLALLAWEYAGDKQQTYRFTPAFPTRLFGYRAYAAIALSTLLLGYPYLLLIYSIPQRAQVVSGKSALTSGIMLLPMLGASAAGSAISGKLNIKRNFFCETVLAGACLMTLGCGLLATVHTVDDDAKAQGFLVFAGMGFGLATAASSAAATVEVPRSDHGKSCPENTVCISEAD